MNLENRKGMRRTIIEIGLVVDTSTSVVYQLLRKRLLVNHNISEPEDCFIFVLSNQTMLGQGTPQPYFWS